MTNFSTDSAMCRVDFFKPGGKWYTTEAVDWNNEYFATDVHAAFLRILCKKLGNPETGINRLTGMTAVCLEPYCKLSHPLMVIVP